MLIEVGAFILSYIAIEAVGYVFSFVKRKIRENGYENLGFVYKLDQEYQPTEVDVELIGQSKDLLNKYFQEDNRVGVLQSKSIEDRIELIKQLTEDIVALYDVDVQMVKFSPSSEIGLYCGGYFNSETNEVAINLDLLSVQSSMSVDMPFNIRRLRLWGINMDLKNSGLFGVLISLAKTISVPRLTIMAIIIRR